MNCTVCGSESKVIDSRPHGLYWKRRRVCVTCGLRWNTVEVTENMAESLIKVRACKLCSKPRHKEGADLRGLCKDHLYQKRRAADKARKLNIKLKAST